MIDADRWGAIRGLADRQFGLFTTAQARNLGVAPYVLARLAAREAIVRIHHGVYELPPSPRPGRPSVTGRHSVGATPPTPISTNAAPTLTAW